MKNNTIVNHSQGASLPEIPSTNQSPPTTPSPFPTTSNSPFSPPKILIITLILTATGLTGLLLWKLQYSQSNPPTPAIPTPARKELSWADLQTSEGKTLAEGRNTTPVGPYQLKTYRIEELTPPQPIEVMVSGQTIQAQKAWRVTVTGGPFHLRALWYTIWIDDTLLGRAMESEDLSEISVITFDQTMLHNGAIIAVSYGTSGEDRTELPEQLSLPGNP